MALRRVSKRRQAAAAQVQGPAVPASWAEVMKLTAEEVDALLQGYSFVIVDGDNAKSVLWAHIKSQSNG